MSDVVPFLAAIAKPVVARPLVQSMSAIVRPVASSPWSPQASAPVVVAASVVETPVVDVAAIEAAARERGRAEGLAETAALRAQLAAAIAAFESATAQTVEHGAELVADAAVTVVEAWVGACDRRELFAPIVRSWLAAGGAPATAYVHPGEVAAMTAAVGEAAIRVQSDAGVSPGNARIANAAQELAHEWEPRLHELRDAIATALEAK